MQANTTDEELRYAGLPDSYRTHIVAFCARHSDSAAGTAVKKLVVAE